MLKQMLKQLFILVRREFWEYRGTFVVLPSIIVAVVLALLMLGAIAPSTDSLDIRIEAQGDQQVEFFDGLLLDGNLYKYTVRQLDGRLPEDRARYLGTALRALSVPLLICLWFVTVFYLLGALYDDRRDRSILFWKSMPVSDGMTVVSKLVTALVALPGVYLLGIGLLQLVVLCLLSVSAAGADVPIYNTIWAPASLIVTWFSYLGSLLFYSVWALPFFGWLLAVSAFAKSAPLAWAIGIPLLVRIVEAILTDSGTVGNWMQDHIIPIRFLDRQRSIAENVWDLVFSFQMLSALIVGVVLVFLAIWLRRNADEI